VDNSDISIVVQGAVSTEYTPQCLKSLRAALPDAEIILSTWLGADTEGLDYDVLMLSEDPGAEVMDKVIKTYNNVNRQLVSTQVGLTAAHRKYCLKFRTDMELLNADFIRFFGKYDLEETPAQYFKNRIIVCNYYTRNPRILPVPFHPSDWIAFGLTKDLQNYYSIPLQDASEASWFESHHKRVACFKTSLSRYVPEQYICLNFIKKYKQISCRNYYDASTENIVLTEQFFAENMVVLDYESILGIKFSKYNPERYGDKYHILYYRDWLNLYHRYSCNRQGLYWQGYVIKNIAKKFFYYYIRSLLVQILVALHLKEQIKRLLGKIIG
jgi:hypothetical protein